MVKYMSSPGWLGTSVVTSADRIEHADNVVCGVDYASGPDRTGLTYLVPRKPVGPAVLPQFERVDCPPVAHTTGVWRKMEADADLRARLARECASEDLHSRVLTATGAELDALAEKYGLARTSPVAPKAKDARPTLRIYDDCGVVLAEGPVHAERTEKGARLRFAGQCCATGTAECYAVYANGKQVTWGQMGRGVRPLHMMQALSSGLYVTVTLDVNDASEEQLRALGVAAEPKASVGPLPSLADAMRDDLGNDPAQWLARGRRATPPLFGGGESAFCVFVANLKAYDARERGEKAERRQREAALVALVDAVPEELDATGWQAAVLTFAEMWRSPDRAKNIAFAVEQIPSVLRGNRAALTAYETAALAAYRRALAPHKAPAPEKRRGGKAVRLTVDDGRDDS